MFIINVPAPSSSFSHNQWEIRCLERDWLWGILIFQLIKKTNSPRPCDVSALWGSETKANGKRRWTGPSWNRKWARSARLERPPVETAFVLRVLPRGRAKQRWWHPAISGDYIQIFVVKLEDESTRTHIIPAYACRQNPASENRRTLLIGHVMFSIEL